MHRVHSVVIEGRIRLLISEICCVLDPIRIFEQHVLERLTGRGRSALLPGDSATPERPFSISSGEAHQSRHTRQRVGIEEPPSRRFHLPEVHHFEVSSKTQGSCLRFAFNSIVLVSIFYGTFDLSNSICAILGVKI